jgi:UDPglucose--hexose-1-phosphate uridylyltransferase
MMGCSNPHPHGQIWSLSSLPNEIVKEDAAQRAHRQSHGKTLLSDYLEQELSARERVVAENEHFVCVVPFWAIWPFETMVISRRPAQTIDELTDAERTALADILKSITVRYNKLFQVPFPYSFGLHQRPKNVTGDHWHFHGHFFPPLLRSATVRKFMVGFELLAMPQRDITPEVAADRLRGIQG